MTLMILATSVLVWLISFFDVFGMLHEPDCACCQGGSDQPPVDQFGPATSPMKEQLPRNPVPQTPRNALPGME